MYTSKTNLLRIVNPLCLFCYFGLCTHKNTLCVKIIKIRIFLGDAESHVIKVDNSIYKIKILLFCMHIYLLNFFIFFLQKLIQVICLGILLFQPSSQDDQIKCIIIIIVNIIIILAQHSTSHNDQVAPAFAERSYRIIFFYSISTATK